MGTGSKSKAISETLRAEILRGKFDSTRRLPSEHQLMRRFAATGGARAARTGQRAKKGAK